MDNENSNLALYEKLRTVPDVAKKAISGGRLSGMTNISPMWRIQRLTEVFGPCGIGWVTEITGQRVEDGVEDQKVAVVDINLYIKVDGEWSRPIPGTGGSMLVANESKGKHTSDEAFKMAYTDAISVAAKSLGLAADVYYSEGAGFRESTKYDTDDLNNHSLLAVKRRIEQSLTAKIQRGMDLPDILSYMEIVGKVPSEKNLNTAMQWLNWLDEFERQLRKL